ncbi:MAG: aldo/keto reductase [Vicinamibacterales bacterium]
MSTITRREWLNLTLGAGAALTFDPEDLFGQQRLITRVIPSSGERLPVIGLGSSATFAQVARTEDITALREVFKTLLDNGATLFDTAPQYGASEEVAAKIVRDAGWSDRLFWATKVNVAGRGNAVANPSAARAQIDTSLERIGRARIDLIQVHNLGDVPTQLPILREYKQQGKIKYLGVTTTFDQQYDELVAILKREQLDFIGVDYAIDSREVEETILPLARDRGVAVLAYAPFGRTRLFRRVGDRPLPDWAAEFDAKTWAQFFLKWVLGNTTVTATTPATSQARNMLDNIGGGIGRVPDQAMRRRMSAFIDALPNV